MLPADNHGGQHRPVRVGLNRLYLDRYLRLLASRLATPSPSATTTAARRVARPGRAARDGFAGNRLVCHPLAVAVRRKLGGVVDSDFPTAATLAFRPGMYRLLSAPAGVAPDIVDRLWDLA
jgi:hypothetical protein